MSRPPFAPFSEGDVALVSAQLGRPRLSNGTPFPTLYYLSHPAATAAVSRLEADGRMAEFTAMLADDSELAGQYRAAHDAYLADRGQLLEVPEIDNYSAGGMPTRVKCLHALVGRRHRGHGCLRARC